MQLGPAEVSSYEPLTQVDHRRINLVTGASSENAVNNAMPGGMSKFGGGGARSMSSRCSRPLTRPELQGLYHARGHMPQINFQTTQDRGAEITRRVQELDAALQARVQSLCDRLLQHTKDSSNYASRICGQMFESCRRHLRLGVIAEILPHCLFYVVYSHFVVYYAWSHDWRIRWSAATQDSIYYPAVVLAFLLCFRASGCMDRYKEGMRTIFEMEKTLREVAFEVLTRLRLDTPAEQEEGDVGPVSRLIKKKYFKHEFRRMVGLLFACAARDLNDSALEDSELSEEDAGRIGLSLTEVEHAAILVTHSVHGHAFRVYLVAAWLLKLIRAMQEDDMFDDEEVFQTSELKLMHFKSVWLDARQVAYSSMPSTVTHILWLLTTVMNLFMPWEWVTICQWSTWFPSLLLTISFYGILQIANSMENPFGFDDEDIQIWQVAEHLDEEICLIMHYAVLDEVGGENLYRSMMGDDMILLAADFTASPAPEHRIQK